MNFTSKVQNKYKVEAGPVIDIKTRKELKNVSPSSKNPVVENDFSAFMKALQAESQIPLSSPKKGIVALKKIPIYTQQMDEEVYEEMKKSVAKVWGKEKIRGLYTIYASMDERGYDYWKDREGQYIQVSAEVDFKKFSSSDRHYLLTRMIASYIKLSDQFSR